MVSTYRYGSERGDAALRIGVARYLPRGVKKELYAERGYFDLWLRVLSPSAELVKKYREGVLTFRQFAAHYRKEMKSLEVRQVLELVVTLARQRPVSLGCFCKDEEVCHRSVLKELLVEEFGVEVCERRPNASPVCYACEEDFS